jgi:hypothetical protein
MGDGVVHRICAEVQRRALLIDRAMDVFDLKVLAAGRTRSTPSFARVDLSITSSN